MARSRFFYARITLLLGMLVGVVLFAWADVRSRRARKEWDHTLDVAVVMVRLEPIDDAAIGALRMRLPGLEERLAAELERYRPGAPRPFRFHLFGPVEGSAPPAVPLGDGIADMMKESLSISSYVKGIDARAGIDKSNFDSRIYMPVRRSKERRQTMVEGRSEQGGRVGLVEVELDIAAPDLPLIVIAHELFHTLEATDKYDEWGHTIVPTGLAEPMRSPIFPQRYAEIMARNRPISAHAEEVPNGFEEIAVGAVTAREIGWTK